MLIGNTNTKRCHTPYCRAVPQIAAKHFVRTEHCNGFNVICKVCYGGQSKEEIRQIDTVSTDASQTTLDKFKYIKTVRSKNELKKYLRKRREV